VCFNASRTELSSVKESLKLEQERVVTYKEISRSSEEGLAQLNSTYDIYKEEMERTQSEKDVRISEMTLRQTELEENLQKAVSELTESQDKMDNDVRAWEVEKKTFEDQVTEMRLHEVEVGILFV
jgi:septal ring factor EnvC (AmiA/AmiB activator)